jgi:hypothetical protein
MSGTRGGAIGGIIPSGLVGATTDGSNLTAYSETADLATSNVLEWLLDVSGAGQLDFCEWVSTWRRCRIEVDGVIIMDTGLNATDDNSPARVMDLNADHAFQPIPFSSRLRVGGSAAATSGKKLRYGYRLY